MEDSGDESKKLIPTKNNHTTSRSKLHRNAHRGRRQKPNKTTYVSYRHSISNMPSKTGR